MTRIEGIEQKQLTWMRYMRDKIDYMIDVQRENVQERMLQLRSEKEKLNNYIK